MCWNLISFSHYPTPTSLNLTPLFFIFPIKRCSQKQPNNKSTFFLILRPNQTRSPLFSINCMFKLYFFSRIKIFYTHLMANVSFLNAPTYTFWPCQIGVYCRFYICSHHAAWCRFPGNTNADRHGSNRMPYRIRCQYPKAATNPQQIKTVP